MITTGKLVSASRDLEGRMMITLSVDDIKVAEIEDMELTIDIKKYSDPKSLRALRYFWELCTQIGQKIGSDKDTVYLMQLSHSNDAFADIWIDNDSLEGIERQFRYTDVLDEYDGRLYVRCYYGLSTYTKDEMRHLLDITVQDAEAQGIETKNTEAIEALIKSWKGDI